MNLNLNIQMLEKKDATVMHLKGDLDNFNATKLRNSLKELIDKKGTRKIILNMEQISFLDSVGLGAIALSGKALKEQNECLRLVCNNPQLLKLLDSSGLAHQKHGIKVFSTLVEAESSSN